MSNKINAEQIATTLLPEASPLTLVHLMQSVFGREISPELAEAIASKTRYQLTLDILEALNERNTGDSLKLTQIRIDLIRSSIDEVAGA